MKAPLKPKALPSAPSVPFGVPIPPARKPRVPKVRPTLAQRLDVPIAVETGRPSKTRKKQVMTELQDLGEELVALIPSKLETLDLPDRLHDEIKEFHRTRSHEGKRRQRQLIGKLMRGLDVETLTRISDLIEERAAATHQDTALLHEAERWREKLIADETSATAFAAAFPGADLQRIRALVRGARGDRAVSHLAMRAYRELFQAIKELQSKDDE